MKKILIAILCISVILLAACSGQTSEESSSSSSSSSSSYSYQSSSTSSSGSNSIEVEEESIAETISEGFSGYSDEMTCHYETDLGEMVFYVKGEMFRVEADSEYMIDKVYYLFDGEYFYMWRDDESIQAIVYPPEMFAEQGETDVFNLQDVEYRNVYLDGYKAECDLGNVPNSVFIPPADRDFMDMGDFVDNLPEMMANIGLE